MTSLDVGIRSRLQTVGVGISVVCGYACVYCRGGGGGGGGVRQGGERDETWLLFCGGSRKVSPPHSGRERV